MASAFDDDLSEELGKLRGQPTQQAPQQAKGGFGQTLRSIGQTADDAVRAAADTMTFGLLDRALGKEEIEKTAEARRRSPYATVAGDIGGAVATPGMGVVGNVASRALGGVRAGLPGWLARAAGYGVEGAGYGAGQAAGHTYDADKLPENVGMGALYGGIGGAVTGPLARVAPTPRARTPSTEELYGAGSQSLDAFRAAPLTYSPSRINLGADVVDLTLTGRGINSENAPAAFRAIDLARTQPHRIGQPGSPASVGAIWEQLSNAQAHGGKEAIAARAMKDEIAAIISNPTNVAYGTPRAIQQASEDFARGRGNWAAAERANTLEAAERDAARGAGSAHSGLNYENKVRQAATSLLREKQSGNPLMGYTPAERQSVADLSSRSTLPNVTRYVGNLMGGGGGLGSLAAGTVVGGAVGGATGVQTQDPMTGLLAGIATMGAGRALRGASNRAMQREVESATDVLRQRSPLFQERAAATPGTQLGPGFNYSPTRAGTEATRKAITLELLRQQMGEQ